MNKTARIDHYRCLRSRLGYEAFLLKHGHSVRFRSGHEPSG